MNHKWIRMDYTNAKPEKNKSIEVNKENGIYYNLQVVIRKRQTEKVRTEKTEKKKNETQFDTCADNRYLIF